jgi:hypothetical protein
VVPVTDAAHGSLRWYQSRARLIETIGGTSYGRGSSKA